MKNASMKLRKWNSNDQTLMKTWDYKGLETHPRHSENNSGVQSSKVLGIPWNVIHDYFTIYVKGLLELDASKLSQKELCYNQFIHNCRTRNAKIKGPLTSQEVSYAENWRIRSLHEKEFPEEMRKLLA
ncbi:hypothetical protein NPIL_368961, partial [Nephila pilipes]